MKRIFIPTSERAKWMQKYPFGPSDVGTKVKYFAPWRDGGRAKLAPRIPRGLLRGTFIIIAAVVMSLQIFSLGVIFAEVPPSETYESLINEKTKELETITMQIKETYENLDKIGGEKKTLNSELKKIDYTLNQVNLGIKATEVNIGKLGIELNFLDDKINDVEESIDLKKKAIIDTIVTIHKADRDGLLQVMLRNESLVRGAFEVQALADIQTVLSGNVEDLKYLHEELSNTIQKTSEKN